MECILLLHVDCRSIDRNKIFTACNIVASTSRVLRRDECGKKVVSFNPFIIICKMPHSINVDNKSANVWIAPQPIWKYCFICQQHNLLAPKVIRTFDASNLCHRDHQCEELSILSSVEGTTFCFDILYARAHGPKLIKVCVRLVLNIPMIICYD